MLTGLNGDLEYYLASWLEDMREFHDQEKKYAELQEKYAELLEERIELLSEKNELLRNQANDRRKGSPRRQEILPGAVGFAHFVHSARVLAFNNDGRLWVDIEGWPRWELISIGEFRSRHNAPIRADDTVEIRMRHPARVIARSVDRTHVLVRIKDCYLKDWGSPKSIPVGEFSVGASA